MCIADIGEDLVLHAHNGLYLPSDRGGSLYSDDNALVAIVGGDSSEGGTGDGLLHTVYIHSVWSAIDGWLKAAPTIQSQCRDAMN